MLGDIPQDHGLAKSLFTRLFEQYSQCGSQQVAQLSTNYRCHPVILELARDLFYRHELLACAMDTSIPGIKYPLWFVCTSLDKRLPVDKEIDEFEGQALASQLNRFFQSEKNFNMCIMAANRRQVSIRHYFCCAMNITLLL